MTRFNLLVRAGCLALGVTLAVGCGEAPPPAPDVYPVTGTVTMESGTRLNDGAVELQSTTSTQYMAFGKIEPDGTYVVRTPLRDGRNVDGAVPGEYQIIVHGHSLESGSSPSQTLAETYRVEEQENQFDLVVKDADW